MELEFGRQGTPTEEDYDGDISDNDISDTENYDNDDHYPSTIPDSQEQRINLVDQSATDSQLPEYESMDPFAGQHAIQFRALSPLWKSGDIWTEAEDKELETPQTTDVAPVETGNDMPLDMPLSPTTKTTSAFASGYVEAIFIGFDPTLKNGNRRRPRLNRTETYYGKLLLAGNGVIGVMMWHGGNSDTADKMAGWLREGDENDGIKDILEYNPGSVTVVITCTWTRRFTWNDSSCWNGECSWKAYTRTRALHGYGTDITTGEEYSEADSDSSD